MLWFDLIDVAYLGVGILTGALFSSMYFLMVCDDCRKDDCRKDERSL